MKVHIDRVVEVKEFLFIRSIRVMDDDDVPTNTFKKRELDLE